MPELEGLPPLHRPHLRPREDDFADLGVRVGRRRRQRRVRAGGGLAATAGVIGLVLSLNGAPQTLRTVDPAASVTPSADPSPSETAGPSEAPSPSVGGPSEAPAPATPAPGPSAVASPSGVTSTGPIPTTEASTRPATPAPGQAPALAVLRRDEVAYTTGGCSAGGEAGWCMRPVANAFAYAGEAQDYVFHACRLPGSPEGRMTFLSEEELYFGISEGDGRTVFAYGDDADIEHDGETITVASGRCARWTFTWDTRYEDGTPVPAGEYGGASGVAARFDPQIPGSASATAYGFTLDVLE